VEGLAFGVRSIGYDGRAPGEPRAAAANSGRVTHAFPAPTDSRHGSCRVGPLGRLPALAATDRSESEILQPTTGARGVSDCGKSLTSEIDRRELHR